MKRTSHFEHYDCSAVVFISWFVALKLQKLYFTSVCAYFLIEAEFVLVRFLKKERELKLIE